MPEATLLRAVRRRIAERPEEFLSIIRAGNFRRTFGDLQGETLKSMPKGFSPDHVAAVYLRYKQFLFAKVYPPQLTTSPRLLPTIIRCFATGMPFIRYLKEAALQADSPACRIERFPSVNKWE